MDSEPKKNPAIPDIETMQGCMFAGDLAIKKLKKKAICIVGDSRSGKSTLHNYLNGIPLVGKQINDGEDVIYVQQAQNMGVETTEHFQSVTLVPNISTIYYQGQEISLVDFAGFNDENRSYVGVFGVNFMIERAFKDLEQIKFILVINRPVLQLPQIEDLIKPFQNFFKIFNMISLLDENYDKSLKKFLNSISVVVVKSRDKQKVYIGKLRKAIEFINKSKGEITKSRRLVKLLFESIVDNTRIGLFEKAEQGQSPEESSILEDLEKKSWDFFSFEDPANISKQQLIQLPFADELSKMKNSDKANSKNNQKKGSSKPNEQKKNDFQKYTEYTSNKEKSLKEYFGLIKQFVDNITKQTEIEDQNGNQITQENWLKKIIDYSEQFQQLKQLIKSHPYGSWELIYQQMAPSLFDEDKANSVSRFQIIEPLNQISVAIANLNQINEQTYSPEKINKMATEVINTLKICRDIFCRTVEEQKDFIVFEFLVKRNLYEWEMQSKIDRQKGSNIPFVIQEFGSKLLEHSIQDMKTKLLNKIKPEGDQEKNVYTNLMGQVLENINGISDSEEAQKISFLYVSRLVEKAKQDMKEKLFQEALKGLFEANDKFTNYITLIGELIDEKQYKSRVSFKQNQIYKLIASALEGLGQFNAFVIRLYKGMKNHHLLRQHYERRIKNEKIKKKKLDVMEQYSNYLEETGKFARLEELYEQMLDTFDCFPEKMQQVQGLLKNLIQNNNKNHDSYEGHQYERSQIQTIIDDIKIDVDMWQKDQNDVVSIPSDTEFEKRQRQI